jgi:hypothetical protein
MASSPSLKVRRNVFEKNDRVMRLFRAGSNSDAGQTPEHGLAAVLIPLLIGMPLQSELDQSVD